MTLLDAHADRRPCKLYRLFDAEWRLLYIGISLKAAERFAQHAEDKSWWPEVQHITMREFPSRTDALAAERDAIRADHPKYNVIHNRVVNLRVAPPVPPPEPDRWHFASLQSGHERTCSLALMYEIDGTPMSDDYCADEISAQELFFMWEGRYVRGRYDDEQGWVHVAWYVFSPESGGVLESAPFQQYEEGYRHQDYVDSHNFLKFFTWPVHSVTERRLNWHQLPVEDGMWRPNLETKGGFFQEFTGYKPRPFETRIHVPSILHHAGLVTQ